MKRTKKKPNTRNSRKRNSRNRNSLKRNSLKRNSVGRKKNKSINKVGGSAGGEKEEGDDWNSWMIWAYEEATKAFNRHLQSYTQENFMREAAVINNMVALSGQLGGLGEIQLKKKKRK